MDGKVDEMKSLVSRGEWCGGCTGVKCTLSTHTLSSTGADVHSASSDGRTALHYAAINNHMSAMEYLIGQGMTVSLLCVFSRVSVSHRVSVCWCVTR